MKVFAAVLALALPGAALADPTGLWATQANDEGNYLEIRIAPCAGNAALLCGTIETARTADGAEAPYEHIGRVMIQDMAEDGANEWDDGTIWAPDDDETYSSKMALTGNVLTVSGCVMGGLICRGQDWRRLE
ncbi:MAG: DUF2147 domain-containing protein [Pseudomonadota bacterium]